MIDPTLYRARRLLQILELEEKQNPTLHRIQAIVIARQLVSAIEVTRIADTEPKRDTQET